MINITKLLSKNILDIAKLESNIIYIMDIRNIYNKKINNYSKYNRFYTDQKFYWEKNNDR